MSDTVVLVVDFQTGMVEDHPYNVDKVIATIKQITENAREKGVEVVYVRHNDPDQEWTLYPNTPGWEIYSQVGPQEGEMIFDKTVNSAFKETNLREYLISKGIKTIILMGMATNYCIDTNCKVAFEYGFNVIVPENGHTTFDSEIMTGENTYKYFTYHLWAGGGLAEILPVEKVVELL